MSDPLVLAPYAFALLAALVVLGIAAWLTRGVSRMRKLGVWSVAVMLIVAPLIGLLTLQHGASLPGVGGQLGGGRLPSSEMTRPPAAEAEPPPRRRLGSSRDKAAEPREEDGASAPPTTEEEGPAGVPPRAGGGGMLDDIPPPVDEAKRRFEYRAPETGAPDASRGEGPPAAANGEPPPPAATAPPVGGVPPPAASAPPTDRAPSPPAAPPPPAASAPPAGGAAAPPAASAPPESPKPAEPAKTTAAPSDAWDVVPVFYGTDREQVSANALTNYGPGRGRRLELGRALVTVPKSHQKPAIERPWVLHVFNVKVYEEAEDPNKHFTLKELRPLSEAEFLALVRERLAASSQFKDHALIFIHGYNTSFDYAVFRTAQIAYDLKFDGVPFAYSWPSGGGLASYTYDRESSGQSEPFLRQFMQLVLRQSGAKSVSVIAHSMGNQPTLQVLKDLRAATPEGVMLNQLILAAPDVDRDNFENIAKEIQGLANGVTLYAASNDRALRVSRNFYGGVPRAGDVPTTGPLVVPGIDTIDVTAASMDSLGLNHSGYAENNTLLTDIGTLVRTGVRPPAVRTPALEEVSTSRGAYWRYPAKVP